MKIEIKYMKRKTLSLLVTHEGGILIKVPKNTSEKYITDFIQSKSTWIKKKIANVNSSQKLLEGLNLDNLDIPNQKKIAKTMVFEKIEYWSQKMCLNYSGIRLSSARTRWGSCTYYNVISINWRLSLLSTNLLDYVIIHELAHIKEKNHSSNFWNIVSKYCSDYKATRKQLKSFGSILQAI
jgi:predicted metal-dependent hydrolase